ncbi:MAG TPA: hypothetical protein VGM87_06170 [Roseomonas sp.]|jgi:hypothetical protein
MARYFGGDSIRPGATPAARVGDLTIPRMARPAGLGSHVAAIRRQNLIMDAAAIVARWHGFLTPATRVEINAAWRENFDATDDEHAAQAVKRFTFDRRDIIEVYTRRGVSEVAPIGLRTMLGIVTRVDHGTSLPIDRRLENNPQRLAQFRRVVASSIASLADAHELARDLELQRRQFEKALLAGLRGGFDGDAHHDAVLAAYDAGLSAPPAADEAPERMVDMVADLVD